jgi:cell division protein FtsL
MAKLPRPKPKVKWSEEELRQRGVRAVVAAMRLNKEHRRLSLENACCCEQTRVLREYVEQLRSLNEAARDLIKRRKGSRSYDTKIRNTWMNGDSYSGNGGSSKGS